MATKDLKPYHFKKGKSGNPKGKAPGTLSLTTAMRELLVQTRKGAKVPRYIELINSIAKRANRKSDKAAELIWNYIDGKPVAPIDLMSNGRELIQLTQERKQKLDKLMQDAQ